MFPPATTEVFLRATMLAQNSGASEIGIDILLAALDCETDPPHSIEPAELDCESFFINSDWISLSKEVVAAIATVGDAEAMKPESLRRVLLAAKRNQTNAGRDF
jgi:hypothetical protein